MPYVPQSANAVEGIAVLRPGEEVSIIDKTIQAPELHTAKEPNIPALKDITEVWNEAYEDLKVKDSDLVSRYETVRYFSFELTQLQEVI